MKLGDYFHGKLHVDIQVESSSVFVLFPLNIMRCIAEQLFGYWYIYYTSVPCANLPTCTYLACIVRKQLWQYEPYGRIQRLPISCMVYVALSTRDRVTLTCMYIKILSADTP